MKSLEWTHGIARRHSYQHKPAAVVTAAAPTLSLVSCSGHNTRALGLGHGPQGPLLHCHQQSRLVFKSHCGTDSEAAGANPEAARLQQAPPACEFRRRCCYSSTTVCTISQVRDHSFLLLGAGSSDWATVQSWGRVNTGEVTTS